MRILVFMKHFHQQHVKKFQNIMLENVYSTNLTQALKLYKNNEAADTLNQWELIYNRWHTLLLKGILVEMSLH